MHSQGNRFWEQSQAISRMNNNHNNQLDGPNSNMSQLNSRLNEQKERMEPDWYLYLNTNYDIENMQAVCYLVYKIYTYSIQKHSENIFSFK